MFNMDPDTYDIEMIRGDTGGFTVTAPTNPDNSLYRSMADIRIRLTARYKDTKKIAFSLDSASVNSLIVKRVTDQAADIAFSPSLTQGLRATVLEYDVQFDDGLSTPLWRMTIMRADINLIEDFTV